ncbi:MAG: hypothetical protein ACR2N3_12830 [Pyrinomonadaceae bacterium]
MNIKCSNCNLINFLNAEKCARCDDDLDISKVETGQKISSRRPQKSLFAKIFKRGIVCLAVCLATIFTFYLSLIFTAEPLSASEKQSVKNAIAVLQAKGFTGEVFLLNNLAVLRANDNWLNASTLNETAYAATNFPFEVITIYPTFFTVPQDDTERAMILLHEARHLKGADEKQAYEFVWKNRKKLGWTKDKYANSIVWRNVRKQTREFAPNLFICDSNEYGDCTEQ